MTNALTITPCAQHYLSPMEPSFWGVTCRNLYLTCPSTAFCIEHYCIQPIFHQELIVRMIHLSLQLFPKTRDFKLGWVLRYKAILFGRIPENVSTNLTSSLIFWTADPSSHSVSKTEEISTLSPTTCYTKLKLMDSRDWKLESLYQDINKM